MTLRSPSNSKWSTRALLILLGLLVLPAVLQAATLTLVEEASGHFHIDGVDLADVAALDLQLVYDGARLQLNEVTAGPLLQGMLFAGNAGVRGVVKIGAAGTHAVTGTGVLARLSGAVFRDPVGISSFAARLYDSAGRELSVQTRIVLLPPVAAPEPNTPFGTSGTTGTVAGASSSTPGTITLPQDVSDTGRRPPVESSPVPQVIEDRASLTPIALSSAGSGKRLVGLVPVRKNFATFTGHRTLAELAPLFQTDPEVLQQTPAVLLTDGKVPLELVVRLADRRAPGVALKNARLLRAEPIGDGRFRVRCLPTPGTASASVVLLEAGRILDIPLTVAPPVEIPRQHFSKDDLLPALDLNGDGRSSWQDDYILVANLLARSMPALAPTP